MSTKKQQIILTHGSSMPQASVIEGLALGEVLVQHAASKEESALHFATKIKGENDVEEKVLVSVPSKEWVNEQIQAQGIDEISGAVTALEGRVSTNEGKITALEGTVAEHGTKIEAVEGKVTALEGEDAKIREEFAAADAGLKAAYEAADSALGARISTLEGSDSGKSVRTIANEELAAQLLTGKADDDFKTLQDLAAWLESHPEDAAEMNTKISTLTTNLATETSNREAADSALDARISTNEGKITTLEGTVAEHGTKIEAVEGKVTALEGEDAKIREEFAAADAGLKAAYEAADSALDARLTVAEGEIDALQGTVAEHGTKIATLEGKVTALEGEDAKIREEFAAADAGLKAAYEAADSALDTRLTAVETTFVKGVKYLQDGVYVNAEMDEDHYVDLSSLVIDGGEY